jgi:hypothetical protein
MTGRCTDPFAKRGEMDAKEKWFPHSRPWFLEKMGSPGLNK